MNQMTTKEIRDLMKRRGVTMGDLAEEIGVSEDRIDSTLNGYTFLSDKNAIRIMDALEDIKKRRARVPKKT